MCDGQARVVAALMLRRSRCCGSLVVVAASLLWRSYCCGGLAPVRDDVALARVAVEVAEEK